MQIMKSDVGRMTRVGTANQKQRRYKPKAGFEQTIQNPSRRLGEQTSETLNLLGKKAGSKMDLLQKRLEDCFSIDGIMDPTKIINALNAV